MDLATAKALTDLYQYINSDLVFSDLKFRPLFSEIATIKVVKPWSQYHAEIDLIYQPPLGLSTSSPVTEAVAKPKVDFNLMVFETN